jgi:hypothetical protein
VRAQDCIEQTGETRIEVIGPQPAEAGRALLALADDTGIAEHAEVVRQRRLAHGHLEASAAPLVARRPQLRRDAEPNRVAERVHHGGELELVPFGSGQIVCVF